MPERLTVQVLSIRPHDPEAYTQGLVWHAGALYESAGQYGVSTLRQVDPETGEVRRRVALGREYFAEGLALVGDHLLQLTWQEGVAFVWRLADFQKTGEHGYAGEGWGLCYDGKRLVMSDGSDRLTFRDPATFAPLGELRVTRGAKPVDRLNELECADGAIWANVWLDDEIVKIDPTTGKVTAVVDASGLLTPRERIRAEVLNGIAYNPQSKTFFVTGKLWPKLFEVKFVPAGR
jgi:glutaminyl-peptide cyclotransferase